MDKKYIAFIFIFAAALIVGSMIDQGKNKKSLPIKIDSIPPSIPSSTRVSLTSVVPTTATAPANPTITAESAKISNAPTRSSSPSTSEYLFTDSFDQTYKPDWRQIAGDFITIDNHFVATSGRPARVVVGSQDWSNYKAEGVFEHLSVWGNNLTLGIRSSENGENGYYLKLGGSKIECIVRKYNAEPQILKSMKIYLTSSDTYAFAMQAQGNRLTFFIDNEEVCTFADASIASGLFYIDIDPGDSGKYPYIDDIRIREL